MVHHAQGKRGSNSVERERAYLRFLKRRQRWSLLIERGALVLALCALILLIYSSSPRPLAQLAWGIALSCLGGVLILLAFDALDGLVEQQRRAAWQKCKKED